MLVAVAITAGFSVSPGHHMVKDVTVSVMILPTEQFVTVGAQDVTA
jgi:hypothetical protein